MILQIDMGNCVNHQRTLAADELSQPLRSAFAGGNIAMQSHNLTNRHPLLVDRAPEAQPHAHDDQDDRRYSDAQRSRQPDREAVAGMAAECRGRLSE